MRLQSRRAAVRAASSSSHSTSELHSPYAPKTSPRTRVCVVEDDLLDGANRVAEAWRASVLYFWRCTRVATCGRLAAEIPLLC